MTRKTTGGATEVLGRFEDIGARHWADIARCILEDALGERPTAKLARDYGRFLVVPPDAILSLSGEEIQHWLDTWDPSGWWSLFKGRR